MKYLDDNAINVFPDGSMKERPRRGGIGFRIVTIGGHRVYSKVKVRYPQEDLGGDVKLDTCSRW